MSPNHPAASTRRRVGAAIAIVASAVAVVIVAVLMVVRPWESQGATGAQPRAAETAPPAVLVDETTHVLDDAGPDAPVVVEFLDFECEVCGAVFPTMEELREEYAGQVTFAVRYFPLPGHFNSGNAAVAVEAAARQGQFEAMYRRMFETQAEWGEGRTSEAARFRSYADDLGLDMAAFDAAVADPATLARVEHDFRAGMNLGVTGTPGIFVDGEQLQLSRLTDIEAAIQVALEDG